MVSGKRIYSDFKVFSRGYLRNKFGLFFGLIFPVILILIFGAIFAGGSTGKVNVYAQNQDSGPFPTGQNLGTGFLEALNQSSTITVITVDSSKNFTKYLADHSASDGIVIPASFTVNYITCRQLNLTVYGNPTSSTSGIVGGTVNGYANYFNLNYFQTKYNDTTPAIIGITSATVNTQQTKYIDSVSYTHLTL